MKNKEDILSLESTENGFFAISNGKFFKINEITHDILKSKLSGKTIEDISKEYNVDIHEIENVLTILNLSKSKSEKISRLFIVIPSVINNYIGKILLFLCNRYVFMLFLIGFILSFIHYLFFDNFRLLYVDLGIIEYLTVLLLVIIIHEYGHIVTAYYRGLKNNNIYIGFFLIFPVFYIKINALITKNFRNRLIVNFGGIYFQAISFLLFYIINIFFHSDYIQLFLSINLSIILINLVPFYFTDGYWLYSDFFRIDNLNKKSSNLIKSIIHFRFDNEYFKQRAILFYAMLKLIIFVIITIYIVLFVYKHLFYIEDTFYQIKESNGNLGSILRFILLMFPFALLLLFIIKRISYGLSKYKRRNS